MRDFRTRVGHRHLGAELSVKPLGSDYVSDDTARVASCPHVAAASSDEQD